MGKNNPSVTLTFAGDNKQLTRAADDTDNAITKLRDSVDKSSTAMARDTESSTTSMVRSMNKQQREHGRTAESFEDMVNRMIKDKRRLDTLAKNVETLGVKEHPVFGAVFKTSSTQAGSDSGDAFADGFSKAASTGTKSFFSGPGAALITAAAISMAGPVGLTAGGALVLAFGAGIAGLGMKVAAQSPVVLAHFEKLKVSVQAKMMQISKPFEQTMIDIASTAQRVFNVMSKELDAAFPDAAKDISEFVFNLGEAFRQLAPVIGPIMDAFGKILDSLGPQLPGVFQNIANALIPLAETVGENSEGFAKIVVLMLNIIPVAIQLVTAMIDFGVWWGSVWRGAGEAVETAVSKVGGWLGELRDGIERAGAFVGGVFGQMKDAVTTRFNEMLRGVRDFPSSVRAALGDVGRILWDAGWRLIGGLIDGAKSRFNEVMNTMRDLTFKLPSWKGPAEVDAKLLTANGRLIIGSLVDGFRQEEPDVRSYLEDLTGFIGGFGPDQPNLSAAPRDPSSGAPKRVQLGSDGSPIGDALLLVISEAIRGAGGDPAVLGI